MSGDTLTVSAHQRQGMRVFVSYSRKDADFVARIEQDLNALGYDLWVDTEDILAGGQDRWRRSIVAAIQASDPRHLPDM